MGISDDPNQTDKNKDEEDMNKRIDKLLTEKHPKQANLLKDLFSKNKATEIYNRFMGMFDEMQTSKADLETQLKLLNESKNKHEEDVKKHKAEVKKHGDIKNKINTEQRKLDKIKGEYNELVKDNARYIEDNEALELSNKNLKSGKIKLEFDIGTERTILQNLKVDNEALTTIKTDLIEHNEDLTTIGEKLTRQNEQLKLDNSELTTEIEELTTNKDDLNTEIEILNTNKNELNTEIETLTTNKNELNTEIETLNTTKNELNNEIEILNSNKNDLNTEIEELTTAKNDLNTEIEELNTTKNDLNTEIEELNTTKSDLNTDIETLTTTKNDLSTEIEKLTETNKGLEQQKEKLSTKISEQKQTYAETETRLEDLVKQMQATQLDIDEKELQKNTLSDSNDELLLQQSNIKENINKEQEKLNNMIQTGEMYKRMTELSNLTERAIEIQLKTGYATRKEINALRETVTFQQDRQHDEVNTSIKEQAATTSELKTIVEGIPQQLKENMTDSETLMQIKTTLDDVKVKFDNLGKADEIVEEFVAIMTTLKDNVTSGNFNMSQYKVDMAQMRNLQIENMKSKKEAEMYKVMNHQLNENYVLIQSTISTLESLGIKFETAVKDYKLTQERYTLYFTKYGLDPQDLMNVFANKKNEPVNLMNKTMEMLKDKPELRIEVAKFFNEFIPKLSYLRTPETWYFLDHPDRNNFEQYGVLKSIPIYDKIHIYELDQQALEEIDPSAYESNMGILMSMDINSEINYLKGITESTIHPVIDSAMKFANNGSELVYYTIDIMSVILDDGITVNADIEKYIESEVIAEALALRKTINTHGLMDDLKTILDNHSYVNDEFMLRVFGEINEVSYDAGEYKINLGSLLENGTFGHYTMTMPVNNSMEFIDDLKDTTREEMFYAREKAQDSPHPLVTGLLIIPAMFRIIKVGGVDEPQQT